MTTETTELDDGRIPLDLDGDPCSELLLDAPTSGILTRAGIRTVRQLVARTEVELLRLPQFGRTRLRNVKAALAEEGLSLATRSRFADLLSPRKALVEAHHKKIEEAARAVNKSDAARINVATETERRLRLQLADVRGAVREAAGAIDSLARQAPAPVAYALRLVAQELRSVGATPDNGERVAP